MGATMKNTFLFLVAMVLGAGSSLAQSQQSSSLGEVARAVKKTQTPAKASAKVVYDNDNLPADGSVSVVGKAPAEDASAAAAPNADQNKDANSEAPAKTDDSVKPGQTPEEREKALATWKVKFADQKDKIKLLSRELDVLQREYKLKAADFYNNTALRAQNASYFAADDAKYKQQIADKQKDLDAATAKLVSMQEEARKTGVPASATE
jgi:hypothetical protein